MTRETSNASPVNVCFAATLVKDRQATGMRGDQLDDADGTEETSKMHAKVMNCSPVDVGTLR